MKVDELAALMGVSRAEVEEVLKKEDCVTVDLKDGSCSSKKENGNIQII